MKAKLGMKNANESRKMIRLSNVQVHEKKINAEIVGRRTCIVGKDSSCILLAIDAKIKYDGEISVEKSAGMGLGTIDEVRPIYPELTIKENIEFYARTNGSRIKYLAQLKSIENKRGSEISGLDKALISFSIANLKNPKIILIELKDPLSYNDRKTFWNIITPHIMDKTVVYAQESEDPDADQNIII